MSAIGLRVGSYEIVGRTQVPEPGDWHLARRSGTSRRGPTELLVRLLPPDASPDDREALHHQYEVLRALEDTRVPDAVEFYEGLGAMGIAAVHGTSLEDVVRGRENDVVVMSPSTLLDVVLELGETLQRAHHRNRFHGDLSPDRVLLAADGRLWVFGFGSPLGATPHPAWVAPEVKRGGAPGPATDQWCLGVLAAGLVGGGTPWTSDGHDVLDRLLEPAERQWPALGRLLQRMTARDPKDRYPSMHPVRQELLALARRAGGASGRRELAGDLARPRALDISGGRTPLPPPRATSPEPPPEPVDLPPDGFAPTSPGTAEIPELPEGLPGADVEVDLTISEEFDTAAPPPKRAEPLLGPDPVTAEGRAVQRAVENDAFVVVRPEVGTDVPVAEVIDEPTPPPAPEASAPPPRVDAGLDDLEPRGLGAPLPTGEEPATPSDDDALVAGVAYEPSDPDPASPAATPGPPPPSAPADPLPPVPPHDPAMHDIPSTAFPSVPSNIDEDLPVEPNPFATDMGADLAADAMNAPGAGDGKTWDDLARDFFDDTGPVRGAGETILPPTSQPSVSIDGDIEPSDETEQGEPLLAAIEAASGGGPGSDSSLGIGAVPPDSPVQSLSTPSLDKGDNAVPTDTLVTKIAPLAVGGFLLLLAVWLGVQLLG